METFRLPMKLLEKYCQHLVKVGKNFPLKVRNKDNFQLNMCFILGIESSFLAIFILLTIMYLTNSWLIEENMYLFIIVIFSIYMLIMLFISKILNPYLEKHKLEKYKL